MKQVSLLELADMVDAFVKERDWAKYHLPKEIAVALSIEASELLEIFLWRAAEKDLSDDDMHQVRMETADIVIYALSMANVCKFDLGNAVAEKIALNKEKYPIEASTNKFS